MDALFPSRIQKLQAIRDYTQNKTDCEVGFRKELQKLDRSSYIYKIGDILMIHVFLDEHSDLNFLLDLEKKRVIHSVSVSVPLRDYNRFW